MGTYALPDLPYDYSALAPAITPEILELHHAKHHAAYVKGANDTLEQIAEVRDKDQITPTGLVGLEKTFAFNLSGHVLHSIFWQNLSPNGGDRPDGALATAIDEHLGGFDAFKKQLTVATTSVQGSGWGVLAWEPLGKRLIVEQVYDHHGNVGQGTTPLLVFDAWEHAYYLQYKNVRPDYVTKLWDLVS
ncbi:superoxide dismutase [Streptomyces sp. ME19-01-6]|uniref:superoxide dismutase n=1 Tax=Streptomyces sp. ME19-01-6 TaxID=3028686 RepID=UPI0029A5F01E|nr:superoxide dismutase [Streptomyces sp. ME19-01-6]MDX3224396.1 superoxide dismutase [Streptomyces sp. ME19-01-6]